MHQTELFTKEEQKQFPRNQYEAVVYFMAHLDIEMVSSFLDDDKTYQDFPKYLFLSKLLKVFEYFEKAGDRVLSIHKGGCAGCSRGCRGFTFLGKRGDYMDILFLTEGNEIKDIHECSGFVNDEKITGKLNCVPIEPVDLSVLGDNPPF